MLTQTDNATDTVDLSIEILLPTATSMKIFVIAEQSLLRKTLSIMRFVVSIALNILAICGHSDSSPRISASSKA